MEGVVLYQLSLSNEPLLIEYVPSPWLACVTQTSLVNKSQAMDQ